MRRAWRWCGRQTLRGLLVLVPIAVTIVFVIWLSRQIEGLLAPVVLLFVPPQWYFPGLALLFFLLGAFVLGVLTRNVLMRELGKAAEQLVEMTPVIGRIYPIVRQITDLLGGRDTTHGGDVVLVAVPGLDARVFGIVLRRGDTQGCDWLPPECDLVYTPMSYQVGGYALILPRAQLQRVEMTAGEALQMVIMGAAGSHRERMEAALAAAAAAPAEPK